MDFITQPITFLDYLSHDTHLLCHPQLFQSKDSPNKTTTPEEFIRMTKGITMATAKAVAAGNSARQEDVIHTANLSRKAISDMLTTCKVGGVGVGIKINK